MQNVRVLIFVESRYKVDRKRIKTSVSETLGENSIKTPVEVSIAIVGDRKMRVLNKQYRNIDKTTNVLSFPLAEGESSKLPNDTVHLGDIIIAYPQVIREAAAEEVLVDDKIDQLIRHGLLHLLGMHHE